MKGLAALFVCQLVLMCGVYFHSYNTLINLKHAVEANAAGIDNQLQRRADLIPDLVEVVKSYSKHEEKIFKELADARSKMMSAGTMAEKSQANDMMSGALGRLLAVVENYPDLKSNQTYTALMDELAGTANRISYARDKYNKSVQNLNQTMEKLPYSMLVPSLNIESAEYFHIEESARKVERIKLD